MGKKSDYFGIIKKVLSVAYACVYPFILFLALEVLNTSDTTFVMPGILQNVPVVLFSGLVILGLTAMVFMLCGNLFASGFSVTVLLSFFYTVNFYRKLFTGWVFVPADLTLASQLGNIVGFAKLNVRDVLVQVALVIAAALVPLFFASWHFRMNIRVRMVSFSALLMSMLFLFCTDFSRQYVLPQFNIDTRIRLTMNQLYERNGVLMGFYSTYYYVANVPPAGYSEKTMQDIADKIESKIVPETKPDVLPNIIVIMSEAFSDPTLWNDIAYSQDPVPNLHRLSGEFTSGRLVTPAFAGSTCDPEFEFLTGNALVNTAYATRPYEKEDVFFPGDDLRALPNMFRQNGYRTIGVHTYEGDFFNRNSIYPKLGFDDFISLEDMAEPVIKGKYVSDEFFTDQMINVIDSTEVPLFLYGISMQNHFAYDTDKYEGRLDVTAKSPLLDEAQTGSVNAYLQGVYDADKQLGRLIEHVEQSGKPTIIVFFGDHLPSLGADAFDIYDALHYMSSRKETKWTTEDYYKMYTTSYVVWNNFGAEKEAWGDVSPYFLGALTADMAGVDKNLYYEFLMQAKEKYNGFKGNLFVDPNDNLFSRPTNDALEAVSMFEALQYDKYYGSQFMDEEMSRRIP